MPQIMEKKVKGRKASSKTHNDYLMSQGLIQNSASRATENAYRDEEAEINSRMKLKNVMQMASHTSNQSQNQSLIKAAATHEGQLSTQSNQLTY